MILSKPATSAPTTSALNCLRKQTLDLEEKLMSLDQENKEIKYDNKNLKENNQILQEKIKTSSYFCTWTE